MQSKWKETPNALQNNALIIIRRHSVQALLSTPQKTRAEPWAEAEIQKSLIWSHLGSWCLAAQGWAKPHCRGTLRDLAKVSPPQGLGIKGVTGTSTLNISAHWQIGFPWENIICFTGRRKKKKTQTNQMFFKLFCMRSEVVKLGTFSSALEDLLSSSTWECSTQLSSSLVSLGISNARSCPGNNFPSPVLSCSGLFSVWDTLLGFLHSSGLGCFHSLSSSFVSVVPSPCFPSPLGFFYNSRKAVPNYPKYTGEIKVLTQNGEFILYPVVSSFPPASSFAHRSHS